jgi:dolichyl-phosphate beta-glucosyltransferase
VSEPPRVSVVVPAFNEAERIAGTVVELRKELDQLTGGVEIVVVDDGSTDDTAARARAAGADRVLTHPHNRGKGAAVRTGVLASRGRTVVFTDADLAYSTEQLPGLVAAIEAGNDVVIGSRTHPESETVVRASRLRAFGSRFINIVTRSMLHGRYGDTQSGFKGFDGDVARSIFARTRLDGMGFDIEVLRIVELDHLRLREIPVRVANSPTSSVHVVSDGVRLLADLGRVWWWARRGDYDRAPGETAQAPD